RRMVMKAMIPPEYLEKKRNKDSRESAEDCANRVIDEIVDAYFVQGEVPDGIDKNMMAEVLAVQRMVKDSLGIDIKLMEEAGSNKNVIPKD
ncbi:MAG: hypothetical protein PHP74_04720, partial [Candidatus Gracilibacteria bacterium]|nr:hypothetical protein [Candidatus Gracilibacteria bacterium]